MVRGSASNRSPTPRMLGAPVIAFVALVALVVLALVVLALASSPMAAVHAAEVLDLTPDTFIDVVLEKPTLVKFYAPWCPHCQHLAPIYEEAAVHIHKSNPNVRLVGVDCVAQSDLCSSFNVRGYPTLLYIRPDLTDTELLEKYAVKPASLDRVERFSYVFAGPRTTDGFLHFLVNDNQWRSATRNTMPIETHAVRMQLVVPEDVATAARAKAVANVVEGDGDEVGAEDSARTSRDASNAGAAGSSTESGLQTLVIVGQVAFVLIVCYLAASKACGRGGRGGGVGSGGGGGDGGVGIALLSMDASASQKQV